MSTNYAKLVEQIQQYANRKDQYFVSNIPYFINQAHDRIYREAKDIGEQNSVVGKFEAAVPIIPKPINPSSWNKTISFQYGLEDEPTLAYTPLWARTYEFCRMYWPDANKLGAPMFYCDDAAAPYTNYLICPTPDAAYSYTLVYLTRPLYLTAENQTNWLSDRFADLLIYACMVEAIPFLKDDERVPVWEAMYNRALQSANLQTKDRYTDRSSVRDKD